jgi:hypothetical protein
MRNNLGIVMAIDMGFLYELALSCVVVQMSVVLLGWVGGCPCVRPTAATEDSMPCSASHPTSGKAP